MVRHQNLSAVSQTWTSVTPSCPSTWGSTCREKAAVVAAVSCRFLPLMLNRVWCFWHVYPSSLSVLSQDVADDDDDVTDKDRIQWTVSQEHIQQRRRGRGKGRRLKKRKILSRYRHGGVRSRRCGLCKGCLIEEDCSKCINCLDKPKFGGPNTKRQCCV